MYEEKEFEDGLWYRTVPGGAWTKKEKAEHPFIQLLDIIQKQLSLATRAKTLGVLHIDCGSLTRIKQGTNKVTPRIILMIHDVTGMSIEDIRKIAKIRTLVDQFE